MMMPRTRLQKIATTIPMMTSSPPREIPATRTSHPVDDRRKRPGQGMRASALSRARTGVIERPEGAPTLSDPRSAPTARQEPQQ